MDFRLNASGKYTPVRGEGKRFFASPVFRARSLPSPFLSPRYRGVAQRPDKGDDEGERQDKGDERIHDGSPGRERGLNTRFSILSAPAPWVSRLR
jgi:hypothetical protein